MKRRILISIICCVLCFAAGSFRVAAEDHSFDVYGKVYEFAKDNDFQFSNAKEYTPSNVSSNTFGQFSLSGDLTDSGAINGVQSYVVNQGEVSFFYTYDTTQSDNEDGWDIIDDKTKKVDTLKLSKNVKRGAIIVLTSVDKKNWTLLQENSNVFADVPVQKEPIYQTNDTQVYQGKYFRVIIAFQKRIKKEKLLFGYSYDFKRVAEVYDFYLQGEVQEINTNSNEFILGETVRVNKPSGYTGTKPIELKDPHYGWNLGKFYVSGYTSKTTADNKDVFLKNVGDKVVLNFRLEQDIKCLNNNKKLSISPDKKGYDQDMGTAQTDFGHGALIVKYTDYKHETSAPQIYRDYLVANATYGVDTTVQLCEEGDYEIALDYVIKKDELFDDYSYYRIHFEFQVRNGNCMVYPMDIETNSELANNSYTEKGFYLDMAKSRYLNINIKKEVLTESSDGLVEDVRFNKPAADGSKYNEEGIYTITAKNLYTGAEPTVKKIYVGDNPVMKVHMVTGLTIKEIRQQLENGATITEDGKLVVSGNAAEPVSSQEPETMIPVTEDNQKNKDNGINTLFIAVPLVIVVIVILIFGVGKKFIVKPSKQTEMSNADDINDHEDINQ